jgi:multidrug transporter EmrE-like cation transporter
LFFFIWEPTLEIIRVFITTSFLTAWIADVMSAAGWDEVRAVMAPLLLVMVLIPLITISLLVFVAFTSIPSVVKHLSKQAHYQSLHQANAGGVWGSISYALISTFICFFFLLITLPIWWIPPMVAILPPLLWGWLTMRLMSYDVLALHASAEERDALIAEHRWRLLGMGIISGMLGAVPTFFWATSAMAMIFFYVALSLGEVSVVKPIAFSIAPAVGVLLGWLVLGESMDARKALAVGLIVAGVVILTTGARPAAAVGTPPAPSADAPR